MLSEIVINNKTNLQRTGSFMLHNFERIVCLLQKLEADAGERLLDCIEVLKYRKGEYLLRENTVCRHIFLLEEGAARLFTNKKDVEINRYFFFSGEFIDAYQSSSTHTPCKMNIKFISDASILSIRLCNLEKLKSGFPSINDFEKIVLDCHACWLEERIFRIQTLSAKGHYDYIFSHQPGLISQIPAIWLASYLSISPETLSRVRAIA